MVYSIRPDLCQPPAQTIRSRRRSMVCRWSFRTHRWTTALSVSSRGSRWPGLGYPRPDTTQQESRRPLLSEAPFVQL